MKELALSNWTADVLRVDSLFTYFIVALTAQTAMPGYRGGTDNYFLLERVNKAHLA